MSTKFASWLEEQIQEQGWTRSDLAQQAGVSSAAISDVMNLNRNAGTDLCRGIARAFNLPPELVFRKAGLLPEHEMPVDLLLQRINIVARKLSAENREELYKYGRFRLRLQKEEK